FHVDMEHGVVDLELFREAGSEAANAGGVADRQHREILEPPRDPALGRRAVAKPLGDLRGETEDERPVAGSEGVGGIWIEAKQNAVGDGSPARRARSAGEQAHLTDTLSAA